MSDRDPDTRANPPFLSSNTSPWNLQVSSDVAAAAGGQNLNPGGNEFTTPPTGTNGLAPASAYIYDAARPVRKSRGLLPGFNFNAFASSFPEQERWGGYVSFNDKIRGDQLQLYRDFFYDY